MKVTVFREQGEYVASADDLLVHAFGKTEAEARATLAHSVNEHCELLSTLGPTRLSPHMKSVLAAMCATHGDSATHRRPRD